MVNTKGLNNAEVLAALYNNSKPLGLGALHFTPQNMTKEQAENLLKENTYFDYLQGRVMKVTIQGDELVSALYDRDNGEGAAQRVIDDLRKNQ